MRDGRLRLGAALLGAALACLAGAPASALTIRLIDNGTVAPSRPEVRQGFEMAARYWESVISTDVVYNVSIGYAPIRSGIVGGFGSSYEANIEDVYARLGASAQSDIDAQAIANLRPLTQGDLGIGALDVITPGYNVGNLGINTATRVFDTDGSYNNSVIVGLGANLRALGYDIDPLALDWGAVANSTTAWDFNPSNGIDAGAFDFVGTLISQMGRGLGVVSGAQDYDGLGCPRGPGCRFFARYPVNDDYWGYVADLFRYSNDPMGVGPGGPQLDWSPVTHSYFSLDGGDTAYLGGHYANGQFNGSGGDASFWESPSNCSTVPIGVFVQAFCRGQNLAVTGTDLALLDAIGWNLNVVADAKYRFSSAAAVPEPGTWVLTILGCGLVGGSLRRISRRPATVAP